MTTKFTTAGIKAGDPIYIMTIGSFGHNRIEKRTATRVTPTGRVVYEYGLNGEYKKTFAPNGDPIGGDRYREFLVSEDRYNAHVAEQAREKAIREIRNELEEAKKLSMDLLYTKLGDIRDMIITLQSEAK